MTNTFDDVLDDYFFSKSLRPATEWSYRKVLRSFLGFSGDAITLGQVDKKLVLTWRRRVIGDEGLSKTTWNNKVTHMRAIFNHVIVQGLTSQRENPFNGDLTLSGKKTLTEAQIRKIYLLMEQEKRMSESERGREGLMPFGQFGSG